MPKSCLPEIRALVLGYCNAIGIDPAQFTVTRVRRVKKPAAIVPVKITVAFLRTSPLELWIRDMGQDPVYGTKIATFFRKHPEDFGTLLQVLTATDGQYLKCCNFGKVYLRILKEWLATMGLTIGMKFPARFYPKEKSPKQAPPTAADAMVQRMVEP